LRIAHIINPVKIIDKERDLFFQQPIAFKSLRNAKHFAERVPNLEIQLVETAYPEDQDVINCSNFIKTEPLEDEVSNYGKFKTYRKLPLFREILKRLYETAPDADYYIQTNADIGVMPHFYVLIYDMIKDGNDSFCINKRIIPEELKDSELSLLYSVLGKDHAGHDCFVFRRELYPKFNLGDICMGTPWSETTLITNLVAYAKNFKVFKQAHATFHLGDRRIWLPKTLNDYRVHNTNEFARILRLLSNKNKEMLKHETIVYLLSKLRREMEVYPDEPYSKNCKYFGDKV